jgi:BASS family bile acid:Na+ symporter
LQVNAVKMVMTLALSQFLPLCVGLLVCQKRAALAAKLKGPAGRLCTLLNLVLLGMILSAQFRMLAQIRLVGYFGMLALEALALVAGWLFGESGSSNRKTMAVTTAVRNVGVALVIASSSFAGTAAVTATTAYGLFQTVVIALIAVAWGRHAPVQTSLPKVATA